MLEITRDHWICEMGPDNAPCAIIDPDTTVAFTTFDCYHGNLLPEGNTFANVDRSIGNPATGPVYINGAEPGDMLKIRIERLEMGPVGILDIGPNSGALGCYFSEPVIKRLPVKDGYLYYNKTVKVPIRPMIGVIGTAPAGEPVRTMTPMDHGANMDCSRIEEGSTLYLPVFVPGALLALGDFHAIMGDGEVGNCGVEIEGRAVLHIDLVKQPGLSFPMLENEEQWITIAYGKTLDEASDKCVKQMFRFLCEKQGLNAVDAGMLIDLMGDLIVCQIVNPLKTVRVEVPKWLIRSVREGKNI